MFEWDDLFAGNGLPGDEDLEDAARDLWHLFTALKHVGFSEDQAMAILLTLLGNAGGAIEE